MKQRYATYASELSTLGYDTTPLKGKVPILKAWQTRPAHEHSQYGNSNIGILCGGAHNIVAVDIDVKDKETSELIKQKHGHRPIRLRPGAYR